MNGLAVAVLAAVTIVCIAVLVLGMGKRGELLSLPALVLALFILAQPVSGLVHVLTPSELHTGYFNLDDPNQVLVSTVLAVLAAVGLLFGDALVRRSGQTVAREESDQRLYMPPEARRTIIVVSLLLVPLTLPAYRQITAFADEAGLERIIALTDGMARVGFLAQWFAWTLVAATFVIATVVEREWRRAAVLAAGVTLTAVALDWTGGRAVVLVYVLPLIIAIMPTFSRRARISLTVIATGAAIWSFSAVTASRLGNSSSGGALAIVDWQTGRFSMSGFASEFVSSDGLLLGETYVAGMMQVPNGVAQILGAEGLFRDARTITQVSAEWFFDSSSGAAQYVVPGYTAEAFINFGYVGVFIAYFGLGAIVRGIQGRFNLTSDLSLRLALAFFGVTLAFTTVTSQSGAVFNYVLFSGLPMTALLVWRLAATRSDGAEAMGGAGRGGGASEVDGPRGSSYTISPKRRATSR